MKNLFHSRFEAVPVILLLFGFYIRILFHVSFLHLKSYEATKTPAVIKDITWEDFIPLIPLAESRRFFSEQGLTISHCALKCSKISKCRSFNYCSRRFCELNFADAFSIGKNQNLLNANSNCAHYGIKHSFPVCTQKFLKQNIQEDDNPGFCRIDKKRIDRE